jgi:hypothetical protein
MRSHLTRAELTRGIVGTASMLIAASAIAFAAVAHFAL